MKLFFNFDNFIMTQFMVNQMQNTKYKIQNNYNSPISNVFIVQ